MSKTAKLKWLLFVTIFLALLIVVFQNLTQVDVRILFWTISLPQAALLTATALIGFVLGLLAAAMQKVRGWQAKKNSARRASE